QVGPAKGLVALAGLAAGNEAGDERARDTGNVRGSRRDVRRIVDITGRVIGGPPPPPLLRRRGGDHLRPSPGPAPPRHPPPPTHQRPLDLDPARLAPLRFPALRLLRLLRLLAASHHTLPAVWRR